MLVFAEVFADDVCSGDVPAVRIQHLPLVHLQMSRLGEHEQFVYGFDRNVTNSAQTYAKPDMPKQEQSLLGTYQPGASQNAERSLDLVIQKS